MELSPDQYMIQQEVGVCLFSTISPSQTLLSLFSSNQTLQILRIEVRGLNLLHQNEEVFSCGRFQQMNLPSCQTLRPESLAELQQKQSLLFVLVLFLSRALCCRYLTLLRQLCICSSIVLGGSRVQLHQAIQHTLFLEVHLLVVILIYDTMFRSFLFLLSGYLSVEF